MRDNETGVLQQLEKAKIQANLEILLRSLPELKSAMGRKIPGQIVVLDSLWKPLPYLRSVPWSTSRVRASTEDYNPMRDILKSEATRIWAGKNAKIEAPLIRSAVLQIRKEIGLCSRHAREASFRDLVEERAHALNGSVFQQFIVPALEGRTGEQDDNFCFTKQYIGHMRFGDEDMAEAFLAIVGEVLTATAWFDDEELTEELISEMHPLVVPFSALGALRGVAVWFLFGDAEREYVKQEQKASLRGLPDTLSTHASNVVLDVFRTHLTQTIQDHLLSGDEGTIGEWAMPALRYLYPSVDTQPLLHGDAEVLGSHKMVLNFRDEGVSRFLGFKGISWTLLHSRDLGNFYSWAPDVGPLQLAYQDRIELELLEIAGNVQHLQDAVLGTQLGMLGHQIGTLFKVSGLFDLLESVEAGIEMDRKETGRVLTNLLPAWGISQALSLNRKVHDNPRSVLRHWLNPSFAPDMGDELCEDIVSMVYYFFQSPKDAPFLSWFRRRSDGSEAPFEGNAKLTSIRLLKDDPLLLEKTFALAAGVVEMSMNLRRYPGSRGNEDKARQAMAALPAHSKRVIVDCVNDGNQISLILEQPYALAPGRQEPETPQSIRHIQQVEKQLRWLSPNEQLIRTSNLERVGNEPLDSKGKIIRCQQSWEFHWRRFWEIASCHES